MNKYIRVVLVLLSVIQMLLAWGIVYQLEPASPLLPFLLVFVSGVTFRQALED